VIAELVPPGLVNVGFVAAIDGLAGEFERRYQISIRLENAWPDCRLNHEVATFLYKAVREFLMNAMKHGGADEILISLSRTEAALAVTVQDNGSGFEAFGLPLTPGTDSGFGLFNVKNRAEYYGGDMAIGQSTDLGGGKITVWVAPAKALKV
jgi:signal transduction histidine kinase